MNNAVMKRILAAKKYKTICIETIRRTINNLEPKYSDNKELLRKVKEELYNIHLNYFKNFNYKQASALMKKAYNTGDKRVIIEAHEELMKRYDNNRLLTVEEGLYDEVFRITGKPRTIIDLACGLNPLTLPWMGLGKNASYYCYDIEQNLISFLNDYFKIIGSDYKAYLRDVISTPPKEKADAAFLFKSTTCFEWQSPGTTLNLLKQLNTKWAVLTLMMRGEKNVKGSRNYFKNLLKGLDYSESKELVFKKEYAFIIKLNK